MDFDVRVVPKGANGTVRLSLDYDGAAPPEQLFADLTMIGWQVPAPTPPPREAIDWSTPDPATGQRFTLKSWQVEGTVIEPPVGSGPRGAWSIEESRPLLKTLDGVLTRHGVSMFRHAAEAESAPPLPAPPTATGGAEPGTNRPNQASRRSFTAPDIDPMPTPSSIGVPDHLDPVRLVAEVRDGAARQRVEQSLATIGVTVRVVEVERISHEQYRASTYDRAEQVPVVDISMPRSSLLAAVAILHGLGVEAVYSTERFIEVDSAADTNRTATPILAAVRAPDDAPAGGAATIRLLIDPPRRILIEDELDGLPIDSVTWTKSERITTEKFRGSEYERSVTALQVDVTLAPDLVVPVGSLLADAGGISTDDGDRFQVRMPMPAAASGDSESATKAGSEGLRTA